MKKKKKQKKKEKEGGILKKGLVLYCLEFDFKGAIFKNS